MRINEDRDFELLMKNNRIQSLNLRVPSLFINCQLMFLHVHCLSRNFCLLGRFVFSRVRAIWSDYDDSRFVWNKNLFLMYLLLSYQNAQSCYVFYEESNIKDKLNQIKSTLCTSFERNAIIVIIEVTLYTIQSSSYILVLLAEVLVITVLVLLTVY